MRNLQLSLQIGLARPCGLRLRAQRRHDPLCLGGQSTAQRGELCLGSTVLRMALAQRRRELCHMAVGRRLLVAERADGAGTEHGRDVVRRHPGPSQRTGALLVGNRLRTVGAGTGQRAGKILKLLLADAAGTGLHEIVLFPGVGDLALKGADLIARLHNPARQLRVCVGVRGNAALRLVGHIVLDHAVHDRCGDLRIGRRELHQDDQAAVVVDDAEIMQQAANHAVLQYRLGSRQSGLGDIGQQAGVKQRLCHCQRQCARELPLQVLREWHRPERCVELGIGNQVQLVRDLLQQRPRHQDLDLAAHQRHRVRHCLAAERALQGWHGETLHIDREGACGGVLLGHHCDRVGIAGCAKQQAEAQDQRPVAAQRPEKLSRRDGRILKRRRRLLEPLVQERQLRHIRSPFQQPGRP